MNPLTLTIGSVACLMSLSSASANTEEAQPDDCLDTASTNSEFAECSLSKIRSAEARLDFEFKRLLDDIGGPTSDRGRLLIEEQSKWQAFREIACRTYEIGYGREGQVLHGPLCVAQAINDRADDLNVRYTITHPE